MASEQFIPQDDPSSDTVDHNESLLSVRGLRVFFYTEEGVVKAVEGIDFDIRPGETLGLIGESGSGKTVSALSVVKLLPIPPAQIIDGQVMFEGEDLLTISDDEMRMVRGGKIAMIFQDPMTSLNPLLSVADQIAENLKVHQKMTHAEAIKGAVQMMKEVGIPDAEKRSGEYPHQFSGGMRQRIMIAIALSCRPKLLIADEPTTALDVTIQAQVLKLVNDLKTKYDTAILYITHNFAVIAEIADRIAVMYAGYIVEEADVYTIFDNPSHPYTQDLLSSIPRVDRKLDKLEVIQGSIPNLINPPSGCRFHPRCKKATDRCSKVIPRRTKIGSRHYVRCLLYEEEEA